MGWIIAIIVGGIAGWLASIVMKRDASMGIIWNVIAGCVGSVVGNWIAGNLGPRGLLIDARDGVSALLSLARQAPDLSARAERLSREIDAMAENGLRFDQATAHAIGKAEARHTRSGRIALWVIALTLVYIAWKLL